MDLSQQNKQEQQITQLKQFKDYVSLIMEDNNTKIEYQKAYHAVHQLYKNQQQESIIKTIKNILHNRLPLILSQISIESKNVLLQTSQTIERTQKKLQDLKQICLYYENKQKDIKRDEYIPLITIFNEIFLNQFMKKQQLLEVIGKTIAIQHIASKQQNIKAVLKKIKIIDLKQDHFTKHFVKYYLPLLNEHYLNLSKQKFTQFNTSQLIINYLNFAEQELKKQTDFLNSFWISKQSAQNKNFILRQLYETLVGQYKTQIYQKHKQKLFGQLTLNILQLFKYGKNDDIQKHANWYNQVIKQKLSSYDSTHNSEFIDKICQFFNKIMAILQNTNKKFDIHYRSRFAFEQWINTQRVQMPLRLNQFIKDYCQNKSQQENDDKFLQKISIIFRLMKQKNAFEKIYRRQLVNRILKNLYKFNLQRQMKIIHLMQKQCSQQFIKNIKPIIDNYKTGKYNPEDQFNVLLLNSQNWPYDQKNKSIEIHKKLTNLSEKYAQIFKQNNKDKSIVFHKIVGVVKIQIKFTKSRWQGELIVNPCMATLLLYFDKHDSSYQLKNFCCETGYKLDQIYQSVRSLIQAKIIKNQGSQDNYKLALNQQFSHQSNIFNLLSIENLNKFEAKHLEQLKADRKLMVEAIVVKIMKRMRTTDLKTILQEAAPIIQKRGFNFNAKFVQSAVQRLVQKQFIRDFENGTLSYIA